ncbi:MAG: TatD family hydrolase [Muribaculaceae bacterium]|nr:TatD family hydrolase [Muribaculaceae bacterium]
MEIIDIHTHKEAPQPQAVVSVSPEAFNPILEQLYSVGIHPWESLEPSSPETLETLANAARHPQVVAIGECGYDALKGGPAFRQLQLFRRHIELSEELRKPLIIHDVKAHDIVLGLHRDLKPSQSWVIHGFRGKPQVAEMLLRAGIWLSLGEKFNLETLRYILEKYPDRLLAESDDTPLSIHEILEIQSEAAGASLTDIIVANTAGFLNK